MISHIWTVIARNSVVDATSNLISLHNVLEKIDVDVQGSVPQGTNIVVPIDFEVVSLWNDDELTKKREYSVRVELINTDKKVVGEFVQTIVLEKDIRRFRSIFKISGLPVTKSGIYHFAISVKSVDEREFNKPICKIPLEVLVTVHPTQTAAQA